MDFGPDDLRIARTLANKLMASCNPSEYWDDLEDLTPEQHLALDSIAFECHVCNHWFAQADNATPNVSQWACKECV